MEHFKDRLQESCNACIDIPDYGHGRQVYISKALHISQEGVRKWFAGDCKPRTGAMKKLAELLKVDYAWLSLGSSLLETEKFRAVAKQQDAGVYALTSYLLMAGYTVAFTEDPQDSSDITAFANGKLVKLAAKTAASTAGKVVIKTTKPQAGVLTVGCIFKSSPEESAIAYDFIDLTGLRDDAESITLKTKNNCYTNGKHVFHPLNI